MYKEKDLIEHSELMELLGYEDERSFKRWCDKQHIPIIKMGLKKYILSQYLTQCIDNQLVIFAVGSKIEKTLVKTNFEPQNKIVSKYLEKFKANATARITKKGKA